MKHLKPYTSTIIIAALLLIIASCRKEIDFDLKLIASQMVVNSFVESDSIITVHLAGSKPIPGIKSDFNWIKNANIKLYVDGVEKETLKAFEIESESNNENYYYYNRFSGNTPTVEYRSELRAESGRTYKLEIEHPDYEVVTCETTVPEPVEIALIDTTYSDAERWYHGRKNLGVKLKFNDPANTANYYRLVSHIRNGKYEERNYNMEQESYVYIEERYVILTDPVLIPKQEDANDFLSGSMENIYNIFTDQLIDGKEYSINVDFNVWDPERRDTINLLDLGEFYEITIMLQSINHDTYLFLKSSYEHLYYSDDLFAEPVQVYSNVNNGRGIFGASSSSVVKFIKGTYPMDDVDYRESNYYYYW